MSKRKKERKELLKATEEARKMTAGKLFRLFLKSILFAILVGIVFTILTVFDVPWIDRWYVQFGLILLVYILAYPFLMSEFRPKTYLKGGK